MEKKETKPDIKPPLYAKEWQFEQLGFEKNIWYDKNDPKSKGDDVKFCEYSIKVTEECTLMATFGYDRKGLEWECFATTPELQINDEHIELPFSCIGQFKDMFKLINGKSLKGKIQ